MPWKTPAPTSSLSIGKSHNPAKNHKSYNLYDNSLNGKTELVLGATLMGSGKGGGQGPCACLRARTRIHGWLALTTEGTELCVLRLALTTEGTEAACANTEAHRRVFCAFLCRRQPFRGLL